jgi:hypothetical protein
LNGARDVDGRFVDLAAAIIAFALLLVSYFS